MQTYLIYWFLFIVANQSSLSSLTCNINDAFQSTLPFNGNILFLEAFSVNQSDGCVWKSQ